MTHTRVPVDVAALLRHEAQRDLERQLAEARARQPLVLYDHPVLADQPIVGRFLGYDGEHALRIAQRYQGVRIVPDDDAMTLVPLAGPRP